VHPVDTIIITSSTGGMSGSTNEQYVIAFNEVQNNYIVHNYINVTQKTVHGNRDSLIKTIQRFPNFVGKTPPRNLMDSLLAALSTEYEKPTFDDLGLTWKEFKSYTGVTAIKKIARKYNVAWRFNLTYTSADANQIIFKSIQNPDTFNVYLTTGLDTTQTTITDYWNYTSVMAISGERSYGYSGQYPDIYRQPWNVSLVGHNDFVNLKINRFLIQLIPKRFYNRKELELTKLTDAYIKWYLKRIGFGIHDFNEF
jgi:hypothetical protein